VVPVRLSKEKLELAGRFIERKARPLDKTLFQYHFGAVSADAVLAELAHYQNSDGGFGHGLEADFRLAASSPMATSVGLQYAVSVNTWPEHPMIVEAMRYLVSTYNSEGYYWPATFLDVNDEPHAPWWHLKEVCVPLDDDWPNPNAELAGYLYRYASLIPPDLLAKIGKRLAQSLEQGGGMMSAMKFYSILCWQRALPYFPSDIQALAVTRMRAAAHQLPLIPEDMMEVNISWLAPTPDSVIAQELPDKVHELLEREITRQSADGGWWPAWEWGQYPEAWAIARQEWAGRITLEVLLALQAHGKSCQ
jgi:hypothetical protein